MTRLSKTTRGVLLALWTLAWSALIVEFGVRVYFSVRVGPDVMLWGTSCWPWRLLTVSPAGSAARRWRRPSLERGAERQILANLDHPSIAKVFDGGVTEDGLPYLVMEYVDGEPIDSHCGRVRAGLARRLELFQEVCAAVQHAHRHLVVHRDLKPSNVLVSADGAVKLLDFGIAKLLEPDKLGADKTVPLTRTGLLVMTPEYAAPEQVRREEVTTSTDVYALGVVLYELLTGSRPHDLEAASPTEIERAICETEPSAPPTNLEY